MTGPAQQSLFAGSDVTIDETFSTAVRRELDGTSWIEVVPGRLTGDDALMARLLDAVPFAQHQRRMYVWLDLYRQHDSTGWHGDRATRPAGPRVSLNLESTVQKRPD